MGLVLLVLDMFLYPYRQLTTRKKHFCARVDRIRKYLFSLSLKCLLILIPNGFNDLLGGFCISFHLLLDLHSKSILIRNRPSIYYSVSLDTIMQVQRYHSKNHLFEEQLLDVRTYFTYCPFFSLPEKYTYTIAPRFTNNITRKSSNPNTK